ncbi:BioY family transporter [Sulfitobacter sp. M57]|uniref:biotin transporter BioY n=1 Tax=unclassified Sulfitobacter TaxID=196795 RepID=UPI0023E1A06E|nr:MULTISPECIES: biotin transporter BioY [unclassified Sulfitobacter]MDF3416294.1 BioY family transporter [Sulfitobacter sp. KE5]MDF3423773.1 BioY family transporter [Sulfitobacter sp. KE43]MDF3434840.1 BioY family transporter [Sulfitobacter sp. KE42]MDF3460479.1 BioY family transporter [Sulfitobacter sp. S74]MDF3464377.1 BioY family transporter [Sulfitobacter sp. Ks18]
MERSVALIAVFAALIAALGLMPTLMLASGIPITAQSLGVMLCGTVLGSKRGGLAALLFVALVALGLPLLAGGRGGLGVFAGPSVGFVIGFPVAAFVTGLVMEKTRRMPITLAAGVASVIGGILALYFCGVLGFMRVLDKSLLETLAILGVYIPGDIVKVVLAGLITAGLARARPASVFSRA